MKSRFLSPIFSLTSDRLNLHPNPVVDANHCDGRLAQTSGGQSWGKGKVLLPKPAGGRSGGN